MNYPRVTIEDRDSDERNLVLMCHFSETEAVMVNAWFDYERQLGLSYITDHNGEDLLVDSPTNDLFLKAIDHHFNLTRWLRDYLTDSGCTCGQIFCSPVPKDYYL